MRKVTEYMQPRMKAEKKGLTEAQRAEREAIKREAESEGKRETEGENYCYLSDCMRIELRLDVVLLLNLNQLIYLSLWVKYVQASICVFGIVVLLSSAIYMADGGRLFSIIN